MVSTKKNDYRTHYWYMRNDEAIKVVGNKQDHILKTIKKDCKNKLEVNILELSNKKKDMKKEY